MMVMIAQNTLATSVIRDGNTKMNEMRKLMETIEKIEEADIEEGIFGKKERSIGEIGAELADRGLVRKASGYAVRFAAQPEEFAALSEQEQEEVWADIKSVLLKVWDDQQLA